MKKKIFIIGIINVLALLFIAISQFYNISSSLVVILLLTMNPFLFMFQGIDPSIATTATYIQTFGVAIFTNIFLMLAIGILISLKHIVARILGYALACIYSVPVMFNIYDML